MGNQPFYAYRAANHLGKIQRFPCNDCNVEKKVVLNNRDKYPIFPHSDSISEIEEITYLIRILICDPIHIRGLQMLKEAGFEIDTDTTISHEQLKNKIEKYDGIVIRSRTKINREILDAAKKLKAIARAGVGLDNIDLLPKATDPLWLFSFWP